MSGKQPFFEVLYSSKKRDLLAYILVQVMLACLLEVKKLIVEPFWP